MSDKRKNTKSLKMNMEVGEVPFGRYPRPQLIREGRWVSLNGKWDCGVNVPFPLQSVLSGFDKLPGYSGSIPDEYDYYTSFEYRHDTDEAPLRERRHKTSVKGEHRVLLHFGAVDQICDVSVDGVCVGHHEGGYLPFSYDITNIVKTEGAHVLQVHVTDRLDIRYPYGKQSRHPGGMWYTDVSGIWQSVWLEEVPVSYIRGLKITPDMDGIRLVVDGDADSYTVEVYEPVKGVNPAELITSAKEEQAGDIPKRTIYRETYNGNKTYIEIEEPKNWTPDDPYLYGIRVSTATDSVVSYFALRTIGIHKVGEHKRFLLNGKPVFFHGVLDQGYYPEGIFLPNSEEGYENDVLSMKELGFNTLRKHIKVEPPAYYVACDVHGMMVWQDMINNSDYHFMRDTVLPTFGIKAKTDHLAHRNTESRRIFEEHMRDIVKYLYNFPCICYYTIFNEGWGQFDSDRLYEDLKELDPTRIVDSTSGWFRQFKSDVVSRHVYFHKVAKILHHHHPVVISEFGGYDYAEKGHTFNPLGNYGYKSFKDKKILSEAIRRLYKDDIISYIELGCSGSIYTQLSDVEDETNGFYTYDRHICKVDKEIMRSIAAELYEEFRRCTDIEQAIY